MRAEADHRSDLTGLSPEALRAEIRSKRWNGPTAGLALGYVQANLVTLPRTLAYDFLLFCQRNPKPCPVLEVTEPGQWHLMYTARGADLRTDLPRYRIFRNGQLTAEATDVTGIWREDFVSFLLGCSFTFEAAMKRAGVSIRHLDEGHNVPMYRTTIPCRPAGGFAGNMVVSMRPVAPEAVDLVIEVTGRYPLAHGAPVHAGDPRHIGIRDLQRPDFGEADTMHDREVPVFWACGVTPQVAAQHAKPEIMITHAPGHMFVTDLQDEDLAQK